MTLSIQVRSQILITGVMYDPAGLDAHTKGYIQPDIGYSHTGGYEYAQFLATRDINFEEEPYCVIFCRNSSTTTENTLSNGWLAGGNRTIKVNLTSGKVTKGEFFYVGGAEQVIGGYKGAGNSFKLSTDISDAKWFPLAYAIHKDIIPPGANKVTPTMVVGDDGIGTATNNLLLNNIDQPSGIGVFSGISIDKNTKPIDAVFYCGEGIEGTTAIDASSGISYVYNASDGWGYKMPDNDWYSSEYFFGQETNTTAMVRYNIPDQSYFLKLGGVYNISTETWEVKRSASYVQVANKSNDEGIIMGSRELIEDSEGVTKLKDQTLPVTITSFKTALEAKKVRITWTTASKANNSHFEILRSSNGYDAGVIAVIMGNGNSSSRKAYAYTDHTPLMGYNYYQLRR